MSPGRTSRPVVERGGANVIVHRLEAVDALVSLPGSKSLTNRAAICAALADGRSLLREISIAADADRMFECLRLLGVAAEVDRDARTVAIGGCRGNLPADTARLDVGEAGTVMRFVTALACLGHGHYEIDGAPRMRERPIGELVDALHELGAAIGYAGQVGCPPLTVAASGLRGGETHFRSPQSSQYVSAILMVAPYAVDDVYLAIDGAVVSQPYLAMTIATMHAFGVATIEGQPGRYIVPASQRYSGRVYRIEPDASAASYLWGAAAVTGGRVTVSGLDRSSAQGDVRFVDVLVQMGCTVEDDGDGLTVRGPQRGGLRGVTVDLNDMPDTVQTLAVLACFAEGPTEIRNVANLRIKETDRIAALQRELSKLGARVDAFEDGLRIEPPKRISVAAPIDTYNDHRMAMSFALAGLGGGPLEIRDADCVRKSFPDYWQTLAALSD